MTRRDFRFGGCDDIGNSFLSPYKRGASLRFSVRWLFRFLRIIGPDVLLARVHDVRIKITAGSGSWNTNRAIGVGASHFFHRDVRFYGSFIFIMLGFAIKIFSLRGYQSFINAFLCIKNFWNKNIMFLHLENKHFRVFVFPY